MIKKRARWDLKVLAVMVAVFLLVYLVGAMN